MTQGNFIDKVSVLLNTYRDQLLDFCKTTVVLFMSDSSCSTVLGLLLFVCLFHGALDVERSGLQTAGR